MRSCSRIVTALAGGLFAAGLATLPASAEPSSSLAQIDCSATHRAGSRLEVSCYNPDSVTGTVDVMYVCSTPLNFDHQIFFNEPGHAIAGGSTLRLTRDCGPEQVMFTYQIWPLTGAQLDDQTARQDQIREQRDRAAGR
ncbi:MAG: hypothetical protein JWN03_7302 [Nocardia sp.]|uniref:hypothetical protein n=1 Tax=Nocardia sp. TaxID=1821 RepID=UPI0026397804|nr:hypothetical protein [Nocardia sp.]MCU1647027.1 hypothetical protein [Nocardia sp.]